MCDSVVCDVGPARTGLRRAAAAAASGKWACSWVFFFFFLVRREEHARGVRVRNDGQRRPSQWTECRRVLRRERVRRERARRERFATRRCRFVKKKRRFNSRVRLDTKRNLSRRHTFGSRFAFRSPPVPSSCSVVHGFATRACSRWPSSGLSSAVSRRSGNARSARVRGQNLRGKYRSASSAVRETKDDESTEQP